MQVKKLFGELLLAALELISTCSCVSASGCPNCIQVSLNVILTSLFETKTYVSILELICFLFFSVIDV